MILDWIDIGVISVIWFCAGYITASYICADRHKRIVKENKHIHKHALQRLKSKAVMLQVRDFGAVPDGVTDCSGAFQKAADMVDELKND